VGIYVAGSGPPLVLVHSVNAAASAAEMRPVYDAMAETHTVFSPDLPGFGSSERSNRPYTPRLMTDALHDVLAFVAARCGPQPIDALALSLGCEFLARAATEAPGAFRTVALVSPTGLAGRRPLRGAPGSTRGQPWLRALLNGPGWGKGLFRGLTRPGVIRYFLRRTWGARDVDEALWRYAVCSVGVPGAEYAPLDFLSGNLFSADIYALYERLRMPVWVVHGVRGDFTDYGLVDAMRLQPNWRHSVMPTGALPYFEQPEAFLAAYRAFLAAAGDPNDSTP
jgi:pimeloyl-ACP methyl ester carboxylesterase